MKKKTIKPKRKTYHVTWKDNFWKVRLRRTIPNGYFDTKKEAVARAKELAKKAKLGQVIVHKKNGRIQMEWTYGGKDPKRYKG